MPSPATEGSRSPSGPPGPAPAGSLGTLRGVAPRGLVEAPPASPVPATADVALRLDGGRLAEKEEIKE